MDYVVIKVNATDKDIGDNAKIKFSLVHGGDNRFSIDENTGFIRTSMKLDRETKSRYSVSFFCDKIRCIAQKLIKHEYSVSFNI